MLHPAVGQAIDLEREIARDARQVSAAGVDRHIVDDRHVAQVAVVQPAVERPRDQGAVGAATGRQRLGCGWIRSALTAPSCRWILARTSPSRLTRTMAPL